MRRTSATRLLAPVIGLTLALGGPVGAQTPVDLPTAVESTAAFDSIGIQSVFRFRATSNDGPMTVEITGIGAASMGAERAMWLDLDMSDYGVSTMQIRFSDPLLYVRGGWFEEQMGGADWLGVDLSSRDAITDEFRDLVSGENDAPLALYWLLGATGPAVPLKREVVHGVESQRYVLQVDLMEALRSIPDEARPLLQENIDEFRARSIDPLFSVDAWVGDDGLVHRARYEFLDVPAPISEMSVTYDFSGFGEPIELGLPGDAEVVRWLTERPLTST